MTLADVTTGKAARVHVEHVPEFAKSAEKTERKGVVNSIDLPTPMPAKDTAI